MARRLGFWLLTGAREHHWLFPQTSVLAGNKAQNLRQQLCAHTILPYVLASMRCHPPILERTCTCTFTVTRSPDEQMHSSDAHAVVRNMQRQNSVWSTSCLSLLARSCSWLHNARQRKARAYAWASFFSLFSTRPRLQYKYRPQHAFHVQNATSSSRQSKKIK